MSGDQHRVPVLVAGGGPSGLAAAIELGRRGVHCLVVEPRTAVDHDRPRAKTTSPRTMEHLRRWGLAERLRSAAPLPVAWSQDVVFCTSLTGRPLARFGDAFGLTADRSDLFAEPGQQVPQPVVEEVLRAAAAELPTVGLLLGHRLRSVTDGEHHVTAVVEGPDGETREVVADYLLGCDGPGSVSREAVGAEYAGSSGEAPNLSVLFRSADLDEDAVCARAVHYWVLGARTGGIVGRLDLDGTWWAIAHGVDVRTDDVDPAALVRDLAGRDIDVDVLSTDAWVARMLLVDRYRGRRVLLVGDAAHLNPPWGGHGFNTCVGDAVNVAWKVAATLQGWGGEGLLDSYEAERRPVAAQTIADAAAQEEHLAPALADLADDVLRQRLAGKDSEFHSLGLVLGYHYAGSPVVADDGTPVPVHDPVAYHGSARPGARLPHLWLDDDLSVLDLLGPGFTLLRLGSTSSAGFVSAARERGVPLALVDLDPALAERYGAPLLLVRPDQHVAWRGSDDADAAAVLDLVRGAAAHAPAPTTTESDHHGSLVP